MFDLGFSKLVVLAIIIAGVWYGFKYVQRVDTVKRALEREIAARRARAQGDPPAARKVEDLVKCERCGAFVAGRGNAACARPDCPWGK
jgi:hypothetical protein